jgi:hypothetical protein
MFCQNPGRQMGIEMRTLVMVGRLRPYLGGCRRLPLLPMFTQNGRLNASSTLLAVPSGRIGYSLSRLWCKQMNINLVAMAETFAGPCVGRPGLVSLAFQPPTIKASSRASLSGCAASFRPTPSPSPRLHVLDSLT